MDSGIEYTEDPYRPTHAQLVGRKRRADDDTLLMPCNEAPDSAGRMPWDDPHKRILFESEDPDSTSAEYRRPDRDGPQTTRIQTRPRGGQPKVETGKNYGYRDLR